MIRLPIDWSALGTVLCIGAHCDDIEIGCGGTLLELSRVAPGARFHWEVLSGDEHRERETTQAARQLLGTGVSLEVRVHDFRGSYFPDQWAGIKDRFEEVKSALQPDLILTHWLEDRHQDHRLVAELTWNTFRDHRILEFEIPKFEGDLGRPNLFMALDASSVSRKLEVLAQCFPSQQQRAWFRPDVFRGLMALRGAECNAPSGFAEAFHARKLVM